MKPHPTVFFVLFALLLGSKIAASTDHDPFSQEKTPEVQTEPSVKDLILSSNIRGLRISPRLFAANPADLLRGIHPTGSQEGDSNGLDLSTIDDKDPRWTTERKQFWRDIVKLLIDEAKQVEKHFPSVKANDLLSWLTIFPDSPKLADVHISLSEIRDRQLLRYHLYSIAMSKLSDGKGNLLRKYLKELHPDQIPEIGSEGVLDGVFARIDPTDKTRTPRLTPDTATELFFAHQYSDAIEQKYPERAGAIRRYANRNHVINVVRGNQYGSFSDVAISFPVSAFLDEFQKSAFFDRGRLEGLLVETLPATETHRYLVDDQGKKLAILWSLPDVLTYVETHVEEKDRRTFHDLRSKYGLDDLTLRRFEGEKFSNIYHMAKGGKLIHLTPDSKDKDVIAVPSWSFTFPASKPELKGGMPPAEELAQTGNRTHEYYRKRGMCSYGAHLRETFENLFAKLTPLSRWLDGGCGEGVALHENADRKIMEMRLLELRQQLNDRKTREEDRPWLEASIIKYERMKNLPQPKGTGVTLRLDRERSAEEKAKVHYIIGQFLEGISAKELGSADLITDVVGAFAYADQIDKVLEKYLEVLAPGGTLLIGTDKESGKIKRLDGSVVDLYDWVASIPGLDVKIHRYPDGMGPNLEIRVKPNAKPKVPPLEFFLSDNHFPPARLYLEKK